MGGTDREKYARTLLLLMEGGLFIAREILKRETQKHEGNHGNLDDFLKRYREQLQRRFTEDQLREILPSIGGARPDDWDIVLLIGVLLEVFRTTLASREKRELLVLRNVRDELHANINSPSLNEEVFQDLQTQLVEALNSLASGLEPALVVNCQRIIRRYVDEPIHMPSSLDHLQDMCAVDETFVAAVKTLRTETRTVVDDIIEVVNKAEDDGRTMKEPRVVEYTIKPECTHRGLMECVETALIDACDDVTYTEQTGGLAKINNDIGDMLKEIKENGDVFAKYEKGRGMVLRIECKTYASILEVLAYMESLQCVEKLEMIATALKQHFGSQERLFLVCSFTEENMQKLYEDIKTENVEYSRSIALSMRVNTIDGLKHVWDMFHDGGAQNHLNKIAEALSEYLGSKITLRASLDVEKFKEALDQAIAEPPEETQKNEEGEKTENDEDKRETNGTDEEGSGQANVGTVSVPTRSVEIIAVKPGTRKTTLFDETICEGERDEISEMGFDTRVDARNREPAINREEREQLAQTVTIKDVTEEENDSDVSTQDTSKDAKNDSLDQVNTDHTTDNAPTPSTAEQNNAEFSTDQVNTHVANNEATVDLPTDPANADQVVVQPAADHTTDQSTTEHTVTRRVGHIPPDQIPDAVRGAVTNFYRDIVNMSTRTQEITATSQEAVTGEDATETVSDRPSGASSTMTRQPSDTHTVKVGDSDSQASHINQEKPGSRNTREIDQSVQLSSALSLNGINQDILDQQQEQIQISESCINQMAKLFKRHVTAHHIGSQAERTTLIGLQSELNTVIVLDEYSVLQNTYSLPQPREFGHIILADETRPGFMRLPLTGAMLRDISNERTILRAVGSPENFVQPVNEECLNYSRQEPNLSRELRSGFGAETVLALPMAAWPLGIKRELQQRATGWGFDTSSDDLTNEPLMLVPVDERDFRDEEMEWRIYTTFAEKALINSLNIHQRMVYMLFQIILKSLLNPHISKPLTSFIIKNIFFHMAAGTWLDIWNESNLLLCLTGCLDKTRQFLRANFIPNFFIQKENLMYDMLSLSDRTRADEILLEISTRPYASIARIRDENISCLLDISSSRPPGHSRINAADRVRSYLQTLNHNTCVKIVTYKDFLLEWIEARSTDIKSAIENHNEVLKFLKNYTSGRENVKTSYLVANGASLFISTSLASHLVCLALNTKDTVERDWLLCASILHFHRGMDSDSLSSKMKFITALISLNHLTSAMEMLVDIELSMDVDARAVCACRRTNKRANKIDCSLVPNKKIRLDKLMKSICCCVVFLPSEVRITPLAMRYEMLRSLLTEPHKLQTLLSRKWAVADAKVYFGFLNTEFYNTMLDMEMYIDTTDVYHMETQMNFLGMFSELFGDFKKATEYYRKSLEHEPVHNAARWHIALMLFRKWYRLGQSQPMIEYQAVVKQIE